MAKNSLYRELGFAKLDIHRWIRRGFPEVIYCPGKSLSQLKKITAEFIKLKIPLLLTKANRSIYNYLKRSFPQLKFNSEAKLIYLTNKKITSKKKDYVLVVTAGTSDIPIAEEAVVTLELMENKVKKLYDVGVAGLHRLTANGALLRGAKVIVVVAGMEGALASIISGLVSSPVIAVPTSSGYGANFKGLSALLTMLNSCSPGVGVVNIDNGFGAGYLAGLINRL